MKLGIGSYAYAWSIGVPGYAAPREPLTAVGLVRRAEEMGVQVVQIADNLPLDALSEGEFDALIREAQRLKVQLEVGTRGLQSANLEQYLGIAQRCGSPILRMVVDTRGHHPAPEEVIAVLRPWMATFEAVGVTLAIENHDRFKVRTLVDIIQNLESEYVGICLDTVNSFGALEDPVRVIETLGPYVVNLHVKDFRVRRADHNMGFVVEGTPAGHGMLDVPELLRQLGTRDFNAILELWPTPESDADTTAAKEAAWVQSSVKYLRQYIRE
jgi:sugar phosphate isomerase/epimerase